MATNDKLDDIHASLVAVIAAWDALPGDRHYSPKVVEAWMLNQMAPAMERARSAIAGAEHGPTMTEAWIKYWNQPA